LQTCGDWIACFVFVIVLIPVLRFDQTYQSCPVAWIA
jgi:hypothetical protein